MHLQVHTEALNLIIRFFTKIMHVEHVSPFISYKCKEVKFQSNQNSLKSSKVIRMETAGLVMNVNVSDNVRIKKKNDVI